MANNQLLRQLLRDAGAAEPATATRRARAWLGEAMAIKDLTAAVFRRQSGSNLLMVGQQDEAALGMLTSAVVSLAAQTPGRARFYLVDGRQAEAPTSGAVVAAAGRAAAAGAPGRLARAAAVVAELAAEVERRQKEPDAEAPPLYLVIYGLQRCRDLRRREDDFGFGRPGEEPAEPGQAVRRPAARGAGARHSHAGLVRHATLNLQRARGPAGDCASSRCAWCSR